MRRREIGKGLIASALWGLSTSWAQPRWPPGPVLFTPQDAEVLRLSDEEWTPSRRPESMQAREISLGPRIVFQRPHVRETPQGPTIETATPMDLLVVFEERDTAVDMQSLRVQARKGIFSKSLTETLQLYVRGTRVEAQEVQVPEGQFLIQIDIADLQGRKTSEAYRLEVKKL
jgi:hypothetical protein